MNEKTVPSTRFDGFTNAREQRKASHNVPAVRFKADDGSDFPAWEEKSFSTVFKILKNNTLSRDKLNYKGGVAKNIHYGDVLIHYGALLDINDDIVPFVDPKCNLPLGDELSDGDIVIADTAEDETVGKATEIRGINSIHAYPGLHTIAVHPKDAYASGFLGYLMNSEGFHSQLFPLMQGIKVTSVSKSSIGLTTIVVPSLPEQKKIAACLSSADETLALCQRKLDLLTQAKKALVQQIFSQKVRFTADDGSVFPDWEKRTLGDLFSISAGGDLDKEKSSSIKTALFPYPVYANARINNGLHGFANYYVISGNSFTVTGRGDVGYAVARHDKYVPIVRLLVCKPLHSENVDFFAELINQTHIFVESTGVPQLTVPQLSTLFVPVPSLPEQKKIAACLRSADALIDQARVELEQWQDVKKSLLQQLFV